MATEECRLHVTLNSVTFSWVKLKLGFYLDGIPTSSKPWLSSVASWIEIWANIGSFYSLKLSVGVKGTPSGKFIDFIVVICGRKLLAVSISTIGWPCLTILFCLGFNNWCQHHCPKNILSAEIAFQAIAIVQRGAMLEMFSWMNWFCLAGLMKVSARDSKGLFSGDDYMNTCNFFCENHLREKHLEWKTNNQHFQDQSRDHVTLFNHVKIGSDSD